jgi:hypothetical protein
MRKMRDIEDDYQRKSLSYKRNFVIFSGQALELWALKLLCGLYYSKNAARDRESLSATHTIDQQAVRDALYSYKWKYGCGLYIRPLNADRELNPGWIALHPLTYEEGYNQLTGVWFAFMGLEFALFLENSPQEEAKQVVGWVFRPSELCFEIQRRATSIALTWEPGTPPKRIKVPMPARRSDLAGRPLAPD